jgi:hypothetical protein
VLYAGAGLSVAEPAQGPRGAQVAERLRPYVAELLGVAEGEVAEPDLESLAARVEQSAAHRMADLKLRAAEAGDFVDMAPNYGHEVVALLLREGALEAVSVNWDRGIENAGLRLGIDIEGVATAGERQRLEKKLPVFKVHGCATKPQTLALTRKEVDEPQTWARSEVQHALAGGTVAFLGLGTVGLYVAEPLKELADLWAEGDVTIRVIDAYGLSGPWREALDDHAEDAAISMDADCFLDDLLRAIVLEALSRTADTIQTLQGEGDWVPTMSIGLQAIRDALAEAPADATLRWWRDGVTRAKDGDAFILDHAGRQSLMAISLLAGQEGGSIVAAGTEGNLTLRTERSYFEIVCRPGKRLKVIAPIAHDRIRARRAEGHYEAGRCVYVAVHGAIGVFPAASAPPDVGAESHVAGDLGGETEGDVRFIRVERAVTGELVA